MSSAEASVGVCDGPGRAGTGIGLLITQRSRVQIPPPLPGETPPGDSFPGAFRIACNPICNQRGEHRDCGRADRHPSVNSGIIDPMSSKQHISAVDTQHGARGTSACGKLAACRSTLRLNEGGQRPNVGVSVRPTNVGRNGYGGRRFQR